MFCTEERVFLLILVLTTLHKERKMSKIKLNLNIALGSVDVLVLLNSYLINWLTNYQWKSLFFKLNKIFYLPLPQEFQEHHGYMWYHVHLYWSITAGISEQTMRQQMISDLSRVQWSRRPRPLWIQNRHSHLRQKKQQILSYKLYVIIILLFQQ